MDVWGPARVSGQGRESHFLLVVDDYTRYTMVFPLCSKGEVPDVLITWIRAVRLQLPCIFLGFPPDAFGWQFYHPTSRHVIPSQEVTFDESVPFYHLFPYRSAPPPPPPLILAPGPPLVDPLPPQGPAPSGVSQVDPLPSTVPVQVAVGLGAARGAASGGATSRGAEPGGAKSEGAGSGGAEPGGAEPGGAEPAGVEPGGAEPEGMEPGGAESEGAESGGAEPRGTTSSGGLAGASPRLGAARAGDAAAGDTGVGGAGVTAGAGGTGRAAAAGSRGACTRGTGAARSDGVGGARFGDPIEPGAAGAGGVGAGGTGASGAGAGGARALDPGAGGAGAQGVVSGGTGAGDTVRPRPYFVPQLQQVLGVPSSTGLTPPLLCPLPDQLQPLIHTASPLPAPSPYTEQTGGLIESLPDLVAACRLDYATALVAESESASPPSIGGECALGTDVLEDRQEDFECLVAAVPHFACMLLAPEGDQDAPDIPTPRSYVVAITGPYSSQWQAAMDAEMASWKSTSTYGGDYFQTFSPTPKMTTLWVLLHVAAQRDYELHSLDFRTWSLRRPVYGVCQAPRDWHDTMRTTLAALGFTPSTADPSLFLRNDTSLPPFYILVYVDDLVFATADIESLTLIIRDRARRTITLTQSHMVHQVLQRFGFQFSLPQPTPLSTGHSLSAPPLDESVEPGGAYAELVGCLMYLMTCTRPDLAYPLSLLARYMATDWHQKVHWDAAKRLLCYLCSTSGMGLVLGGRGPVVLTGHVDTSWVNDSATQHAQGCTFNLGSGSVSWRSTRSSSVLSSNCEAEIYAGAMAAQELRWLTYLLTKLGEQPRSPLVPYVDNKAMIALCQEHRLEHRTKHIALPYFLARELQQCGQLRLAYVATRATTHSKHEQIATRPVHMWSYIKENKQYSDHNLAIISMQVYI
ncbi:unnamed protein product [Closterium sp. NIES-53]